MKKAVIDIDGVLNYYPKTYVDFINSELKTNYKTLDEIKKTLSYDTYKTYKTLYRKSDYKHNAKIRKYARQMISYLRKEYLIYIVTSRELFKYNQLEKTILWLQKNKIHYDYIYCSMKKDYTIFEKFGHVDLVVEDSLDNLFKISLINGEALYFNVNNDENRDIESPLIPSGVIRINELNEVIHYLKEEKNES